MSYNRSYGNNSGFENAKRLHYGKIEHPISEYTHDILGHDCISCTKELTGKIPSSLQCKAACGKPVYEELLKRIAIVKNKSKMTKEEFRDIHAMSKLIHQTERRYLLTPNHNDIS